MPRWIGVIVVALILSLLAGMGIMMQQRLRVDADLLRCQNNLREISLFAGRFAEQDPTKPLLTTEIPAGTVPNAGLAPQQRLSWYVTAIPWFDLKRLPDDLYSKINRSQEWNSSTNAEAGRGKIPLLMCPGLPPEVPVDGPAPTSYFGTAGLGMDAARLSVRRINLRLGNFGTWQPWLVPVNAGSFRYETPTPFSAISDGLSQTIMIGEREPSPGPWLQGGTSTVRGYDVAQTAPAPIGTGGQFGGGHPALANFAYADGHVTPLSIHVDPLLLRSQLTIADGARWEAP